MCSEVQTECVFDYTQDQRRKIATHRRDEDFKSQTRTMEGLFEIIRTGEESSVQDLLALIRTQAPLADIAAKVEMDLNSSHSGQKRKWSVSDTGSSVKGATLASQHSHDFTSPVAGTSPYPVLENRNLAIPHRDSWHPSLQLHRADDQDFGTDRNKDTGVQSNNSRQFDQVKSLSCRRRDLYQSSII